MSDIKSFPFNPESIDQVYEYHFGKNWPVVYILENKDEVYIGETVDAYSRSKQHLENTDRQRLERIHIISDEEYNKSAALDIESSLIQYMSAEGSFKLQNGNKGLLNHNYFDREKYQAKFEIIWDKLKEMSLVKKDLADIRNSDLFKFSPFKALTEDQLLVVNKILKILKQNVAATIVISGKPGTGKTILATYLIKRLKEEKEYKDLKTALVIPMTSLRSTLSGVFSFIKNLNARMVVGPSAVVGAGYDLLIVDEAHRLRQRKNITNYAAHDKNNTKLGLDQSGTELDWIVQSSKYQILFYDENQNVRPADVNPKDFKELDAHRFALRSQLRVEGGDEYIQFIDDLFSGKPTEPQSFKNYDFRLFGSLDEMVTEIKNKEQKFKLSRIVAGYAWEWISRNNHSKYDIEIDDVKLKWNSVNEDWVNSPNSINEVGCIHTIQGYDLNYAGVIIGPEITYDKIAQKFKIDKSKYKDRNGHAGVEHEEELERYIINIYKTLLTRGIKGTYVYIVDLVLREYVSSKLNIPSPIQIEHQQILIKLPIPVSVLIKIPLVGSAPCGNPLTGEQNIEEYIEVEKNRIRPGFEYFILRAIGDSMNLAGINDGDLVLCRLQQKADTGDRVVALLGDNVTIKMYDKRDGRRILLPKSTNKSHMPIMPEEGDSVQGVVQEVLEF